MASRAPRLAPLLFASFAACLLFTHSTNAQSPSSLAATPPMGWDGTRVFGCGLTEQRVKSAAHVMSTNGMSRVGYQYVIIGDCWQGSRDTDGFIQPDPERFPSGIKALADYVHARGLKLGLTSDAGNTTCRRRSGSRGREYQDALQYARWGVDYVAYGWCDSEGLNPKNAYTTMRDALRATARPMTLALGKLGTSDVEQWASSVGHLWRTGGELATCFGCVEGRGTSTVLGVLPMADSQADLRVFAGPGHWNDPGVLVVGHGMSAAEDRAHVSLWAMLAAPLISSNDLVSMADSTRETLTNPEVVAVDQDILGIPAYRYRADGDLEIWVRPLSRGQLAVLFLNRGLAPLQLDFEWSKHRFTDDLTRKHYDFRSTVYSVRDVWKHERVGTTRGALSTTLQSHDVTMLRLTPHK